MIGIIVLMLTTALPRGPLPGQSVGEETRRLIGQVAVSARHIVFSYGGDLWRAELGGGQAEPLTAGPEEDGFPAFSHDGNWIAFSRRAGADWDVYLVPAKGGEPQRLTYHPGPDLARGWTPDDGAVLFMSEREEEGVSRLYTLELRGSLPTALPFPRATEGSFSPDGERLAYVPYSVPIEGWRHYRGGMTAPIWIGKLSDSRIEELPGETSNDRFPMWAGDTIYFVSDRSGTYNLHRYLIESRQVEQLTRYEEYGITHASFGAGYVAFVQDGAIRLFRAAAGTIDSVRVEVNPDTSEWAPRSVAAAPYIQAAALSPTGDRVVFEARGELISFDPVSGRGLNLTASPGVADRYPALSPDGQWIAYLSDESGEYHLKLRKADGSGGVMRTGQIELRPTYYSELSWSPDSKRLAFTDKRLSLWVTDMETGGARRATTSRYPGQISYQVSWSPNGTIMAYSEYGENHNRVIYLYDVVRGRKRRVTPPDVNAEYPAFDKSGKYLFLVTSGDAALEEFGGSILSGAMHRPLTTRRLQVVILRNDIPAPVHPATGEPNPEALAQEGDGRALIHTQGIERRIVPLPLPPRDYAGLTAGERGELYVLVNEWPPSPAPGSSPARSLYRYELSQPGRLEKFLQDIDEFRLSADGSAILYRRGDAWAVVPTGEAPEPEAGHLDLDSLTLEVNPRAEWRQMYREAWRFMRDFFYDPKHHGLSVRRLEAHYASYLPSVTRRADLNALLRYALGHVSASYLTVSGGDTPPSGGPDGRVGLLGADYEIEEGRFRIKRIYRSGHFDISNPLLRAPLDQPGVDVAEGDYLLAIDGEPVTATRNVHSYFIGKAWEPVKLTVGPEPEITGSRTVTVVPLPDEGALRRSNWADRNRSYVDERTQGQIAYIYVSDYGSGLESFFRDILANSGRKGFVIDQRFAGGDLTADYLIELLQRKPIYYYVFRDGDDLPVPTKPMPDAKVLLINNATSSAAETFALMFKLAHVGRVVGLRTTGAGTALHRPIPRLLDGGKITVGNAAAYNPNGSWDIENDGVQPHIEVEWSPELWRKGIDPQLEAAVNAVLQHIVDNAERLELEKPQRPEYPVHTDGTR